MVLKAARVIVISVLFFSLLTAPAVFAGSVTPETVTFSPAEISDVLNNPFMGWAPWAQGGPYQQPHRLVYINVTWRELEPSKGNYAFEAFEKRYKFDYWAKNGKKIILRINMDYPGPTSHKDIPDWLYDELNGDGTWYDIDWGKGFSPNYNNTKLISRHKTFIDALAARYNNDSRVPIIALGSLGQWGEFHTKKSPSFTIPFPKKAVSDQYVQHYIDSFTNKILMMRRPFQIARDNGMGLFNDSFGSSAQTYDYFVDYINNGYKDYLTGEKHPSMRDYWKTAPSGGEVANYPGLAYFQDSAIETSLKMIRDSHTSWLGPCSPGMQPTGTSLQKNFDLMLKTMGYRFVLSKVTHDGSAKPGESINISMDWTNKGVAPFYYDWPLELSLSDPNGSIVARTITTEDIRTWLPGSKAVTQRLSIPDGLPDGTYDLCVGIIDPETGKPGIDLAISGRRSDGRYTLSRIEVKDPEVRKPSLIEIKGSTYVEIPKSGVIYSDYTFSVKDQYSDIMPGEKVKWSFDEPIPGVVVNADNGKVIVDPAASVGKITLKAVSVTDGSISASKELILYSRADPQASAIEIKGATYVEIPTRGVTYSDYTAAVMDQDAEIMPDETVTWHLDDLPEGITLNPSTGKIIVGIGTKPCNLTLKAVSNSNADVTATKNLIIFTK